MILFAILPFLITLTLYTPSPFLSPLSLLFPSLITHPYTYSLPFPLTVQSIKWEAVTVSSSKIIQKTYQKLDSVLRGAVQYMEGPLTTRKIFHKNNPKRIVGSIRYRNFSSCFFSKFIPILKKYIYLSQCWSNFYVYMHSSFGSGLGEKNK